MSAVPLEARLHLVEELLRYDGGDLDADPFLTRPHDDLPLRRAGSEEGICVLANLVLGVEVFDADIGLVLQDVLHHLGVPRLGAGLAGGVPLLEMARDPAQAGVAAGVHLKDFLHDDRLPLIEDKGTRGGLGLSDVVVPVHPGTLGGDASLPQFMLLAARKALDDLGLFELCDGAEHCQREFVFRVLDVVSAIDDELLPLLENLK